MHLISEHIFVQYELATIVSKASADKIFTVIVVQLKFITLLPVQSLMSKLNYLLKRPCKIYLTATVLTRLLQYFLCMLDPIL